VRSCWTESARVREDDEARSVEREAGRKDLRGAEEVAEGVGAQDPGLREERIVQLVPARLGERAGVAARGALSGRSTPALDDEHRLLLRDVPRGLEESPAVREALDVEEDHFGRLVSPEGLEQVVLIDPGAVPDRNEAGESDPFGDPVGEDPGAERSALGDERDVAARWETLAEGRVQADVRVGVEDAEAVRSHERHPVLRGPSHDLGLERGAGLADLAESGGDDHEAFRPDRPELVDHAGDLRRRNDDHPEVGSFGEVRDRGIAPDPRDALRGGVDRVRDAPEPALEDVAKEACPDLARLVRRADDRDRGGLKQLLQFRGLTDAHWKLTRRPSDGSAVI